MDTTIGDRVPLSGNQPVHGYRSQHIQFDGWKRKQQPVDGAIDQLFELLAIEPDDQSEACFFLPYPVTVPWNIFRTTPWPVSLHDYRRCQIWMDPWR
jgi:hypothetical protein